ncbi:hypothetical protein, partial [Saccharothrix longispora]|uniref:hypothetical protein n=1 Tax=Saccharothrix longispora TaxID=33920 RepID=UPI0028FD9DDC
VRGRRSRGSPEQHRAAQRLAQFDALHHEDRLLRLGWAFLCGPVRVNGQRRRVCLPLVSRPVRLHHPGGRRHTLHAAGDTTLFPLLTDWTHAAHLETTLTTDHDWITAVLTAAGFDAVPVLDARHHPHRYTTGDEPVVVAGTGLHAGEPVVNTERGTALTTWARTPGTERTALAALYTAHDDAPTTHD